MLTTLSYAYRIKTNNLMSGGGEFIARMTKRRVTQADCFAVVEYWFYICIEL